MFRDNKHESKYASLCTRNFPNGFQLNVPLPLTDGTMTSLERQGGLTDLSESYG